MRDGNAEGEERRRENIRSGRETKGEENIPEAWLSVSLLSTRWYSPASLVAGSRGVYRLPTSQLSRTMHTIDVTLSSPA